MAHTGVPAVLAAIEGVDFPAGRERLVTAARASGAPEEVVETLRGIPPGRYADREEVAGSVRAERGPDLGRHVVRRPERARPRHGGRPDLAQHLREEPRTPIQEEFGR
ncbi:DUF2795 domain-containing protein [Streptomyces sp. NPDC003388]|uniref:DUF2795 domain-containing protein n=1 Tax=unclassified Streptomyces TaxID=2593676 RepID=UPI00116B4E84|nr:MULTISPECIES: DUF2795 domain-containing protein [unclassified Streptomyces]MDI1456257.1 DUF2795 domain-containing protein [Streptomyces sp. ATE26]GEJ98760.1 hypothetical protein TNCT1_10370 [Streptomyces sp. 1-11]